MLPYLQYSNAYELDYSSHVIIMIYELAYSLYVMILTCRTLCLIIHITYMSAQVLYLSIRRVRDPGEFG
jgi:hypothetical protein